VKILNAFEIQKNFLDDRPVMKDQNKDMTALLAMLSREVEELFEEPHGMSPEKYMEQELADVAILAFSALQLLTGDADLAIREKQARNSLRYEAWMFDGRMSYDEAKNLAKNNFGARENAEFYADY